MYVVGLRKHSRGKTVPPPKAVWTECMHFAISVHLVSSVLSLNWTCKAGKFLTLSNWNMVEMRSVFLSQSCATNICSAGSCTVLNLCAFMGSLWKRTERATTFLCNGKGTERNWSGSLYPLCIVRVCFAFLFLKIYFSILVLTVTDSYSETSRDSASWQSLIWH